jgi:DHA1 family multidrug resistance protein-like MFS transporter
MHPFNRILLLTLVVNTTIGLVIPVLPALLRQNGFSSASLSIPFLVFTLGRLLIKSGMGGLMRRVNARNVLTGAFLLHSLTLFGYILIDESLWFLVGRFLEGMAEGVILIYLTELALARSTRQRGIRMGYFSAMFGLGFLIGPMLGGYLYLEFGGAGTFLLASLLALSGAISSFYFLSRQDAPISHGGLNNGLTAFGNGARAGAGKALTFYAPAFVRRALFFSLTIMLPIYVTDKLLLDTSVIGLYFSLIALVSMVLSPVAGRMAERFSCNTLVLLSLTMMSGLLILVGGTDSADTFSMLLVGIAFAYTVMTPAGLKIFGSITESRTDRAKIIVTANALTEVMTLLLAVLVPLVYDINPAAAWSLIAGLCFVASLPYASSTLRHREHMV